MFERIVHPNGVVFYRSSLLASSGIPHAFATRIGGVSTGVFSKMNLGNPTPPPPPLPATPPKDQTAPPPAFPQDDPVNIEKNYHLLFQACGLHTYTRAWVEQIHSSRVECVELLEDPSTLPAQTRMEQWIAANFQGQRQADALLTELAGVALAIRIADCVPVLLASEDGQVVAAVHAGWRGVVNNIVARTVRAFGEAGRLPHQLIAAVGPCIGLKHFEVGLEVASFFDLAHLSAAVDRSTVTRGPLGASGKPHIDLSRALTIQLQEAGVTQIDTAVTVGPDGTSKPLCTFEQPAEFFSHRRDQGLTGRQAAVIGCKLA